MTKAEQASKSLFCEEYETVKKKGAPTMTSAELKEALKHIAGLCYGLACDVDNMEIETENLRARVLQYEAKEQGTTPEKILARRDIQKAWKMRRIEENGSGRNNMITDYKEVHPLTSAEAKNRINHIAGLCYSLVSEVREIENLQARIKELEAELKGNKALQRECEKKFKRPPEERERRRQAALKYWAKKRAQQAAVE